MNLKTIVFLTTFCVLGGQAQDDLITLEIRAATADPGWDNTWGLEQGLSDDVNKCYSSRPVNGRAQFEFVLSEISKVRLLNRPSAQYAYRMENTRVEVCSPDGCTLCGIASATPAGDWAEINCAEAIAGSQVKLFRPDQALTFCDIQIQGTAIVEKVDITGATASAGYNNDWAIEKGYSVAGQPETPSTCYSARNFNGQAILEIPRSDVAQVALLNRQDVNFAHRMGGATVEVCDGNACTPCGTAIDTSASEWAMITCTDIIKGDSIKLQRLNECLTFCEVEVYEGEAEATEAPAPAAGGAGGSGDPSCTCQDYHRFCQAFGNPNYPEEVSPALSCDDMFYQTRCPRSCEICSC